MNTKIGLLTFHRSHNCGSILQAYAMQEILRHYGYQTEFIDLSTNGQREIYSILKPIRFGSVRLLVKSILLDLQNIFLYKKLKNNQKSYERYINKNLILSQNSYRSSAELHEETLGYNAYVVGSDQVWNVTIEDYDPAYFLDFVHNSTKVAYAVSQGAKDINIHAKDPEVIAKYIKDFDQVSSREDNGRVWLQKLTGKAYPVVLDPTLLLPRSNYERIEETHDIKSLNGKEYIFVYAAPLPKYYLQRIIEFASQNDLKVVIWHTNIWFKHLGWMKGLINPNNQNPGKYLDLIKNAKYVCTSSFHGVAFSTIYRKNFIVLENDGMRAGFDDRMTGFLKRLHLSERIADESHFNERIIESIDYSQFEEELQQQQTMSLQFLTNALGKKHE